MVDGGVEQLIFTQETSGCEVSFQASSDPGGVSRFDGDGRRRETGVLPGAVRGEGRERRGVPVDRLQETADGHCAPLPLSVT